MPRKPKDEQTSAAPVGPGKQVNVRVPLLLLASLEEIGTGMGLDLSSVIRMVLTEHHEEYLERVRSRKHKGASDA